MTRAAAQSGGSGAGWLIPIGLLLLAAGIAALIGSGDEDVVNWLKENSTCNERPCTYEEAQEILTGIGIAGTAAGSLTTIFGLWRALRGRDSGPVMPAPGEAAGEVDASEFDKPFGLGDAPAGDSPGERLAQLDAQLAAGRLDAGDYMKERERILRDL